MKKQPVHHCKCPECRRRSPNPIKELHQQMNFLVSTLDERQQRLYIGLESKKLGHGGDRRLALITGLGINTISKGRRELEALEASEHIRRPGGGRPRVEKKTRRSWRCLSNSWPRRRPVIPAVRSSGNTRVCLA